MGVFNPDDFLKRTHTGKMATSIPPVPEGEWEAEIADIKAKLVPQENPDTGQEEDQIVLNVDFCIENEEVSAVTNREKSHVFRRVYINQDEETEELEMDGNPILGQLREAAGQMEQNEWAIHDLIGARVMIIVTHNEVEQKDGTVRTYANVSRFSALA